jgi:hypothetical protein
LEKDDGVQQQQQQQQQQQLEEDVPVPEPARVTVQNPVTAPIISSKEEPKDEPKLSLVEQMRAKYSKGKKTKADKNDVMSKLAEFQSKIKAGSKRKAGGESYDGQVLEDRNVDDGAEVEGMSWAEGKFKAVRHSDHEARMNGKGSKK